MNRKNLFRSGYGIFLLSAFILISALANVSIAENSIINVSYPAGQDKLCGLAESELAEPLVVKIIDSESKPVAGATVCFQIVKTPAHSENCYLSEKKSFNRRKRIGSY